MPAEMLMSGRSGERETGLPAPLMANGKEMVS